MRPILVGSWLWTALTYNMLLLLSLMFLQDHVTNQKHHISTTTMPVVIKLDKVVTFYEGLLPLSCSWPSNLERMVTYIDGLPPIKSHNPLITWSCEITWQTESIIISTPECLRQPNLTGCWLALRGLYPYIYTNGHQTWQDGDLFWEAPTHKFT